MELNTNDDERDDVVLNTPKEIIKHIVNVVTPDVTENDYKIVKAFNPREGQDKHSAKLFFTCNDTKNKLLSNTKKLKNLDENHVLRKVFIKNETTPLIRKENDRLYTNMKKLKDENPIDRDKFKILKGKLMHGDNIIDEFNMNNSIF